MKKLHLCTSWWHFQWRSTWYNRQAVCPYTYVPYLINLQPQCLFSWELQGIIHGCLNTYNQWLLKGKFKSCFRTTQDFPGHSVFSLIVMLPNTFAFKRVYSWGKNLTDYTAIDLYWFLGEEGLFNKFVINFHFFLIHYWISDGCDFLLNSGIFIFGWYNSNLSTPRLQKATRTEGSCCKFPLFFLKGEHEHVNISNDRAITNHLSMYRSNSQT